MTGLAVEEAEIQRILKAIASKQKVIPNQILIPNFHRSILRHEGRLRRLVEESRGWSVSINRRGIPASGSAGADHRPNSAKRIAKNLSTVGSRSDFYSFIDTALMNSKLSRIDDRNAGRKVCNLQIDYRGAVSMSPGLLRVCSTRFRTNINPKTRRKIIQLGKFCANNGEKSAPLKDFFQLQYRPELKQPRGQSRELECTI